jgi:hypothetical protein
MFSGLIFEASRDSPDVCSSLVELDRENLKVGQELIVLDANTINWYPCIIVDINSEKRKLKAHYKGWKSRFDEWIPMNCDRLDSIENRQTCS